MTTIDDAVTGALQAIVEREAAATGASALLRVEVPGRGVWHHAAGRLHTDGPAAEPLTPFRIASITKTFTAALIAQIAAEGGLAVDDLMADHLPADHRDLVGRIHVMDGVSSGEAITVRQLLTHDAGLFDYASCDGFFRTIAADPGHVWTPREMLEGAIAWGHPHWAPGTDYRYAYSDTGYVLLGLIVEEALGVPLHVAYRDRILDPLGMAATYLEGHEPHRGRPMSHPYQGGVDVMPIHGTADWAGGGLVSDVDDLATFARALMAGEVVPPAWLAQMADWRFRTLDPARHSPGYVGYGWGLEAREVQGVLLRGHRGHWGAWMHVDPVSGLTITGTVNEAERPPHQVVIDATAAVVAAGLVEAAE